MECCIVGDGKVVERELWSLSPNIRNCLSRGLLFEMPTQRDYTADKPLAVSKRRITHQYDCCAYQISPESLFRRTMS